MMLLRFVLLLTREQLLIPLITLWTGDTSTTSILFVVADILPQEQLRTPFIHVMDTKATTNTIYSYYGQATPAQRRFFFPSQPQLPAAPAAPRLVSQRGYIGINVTKQALSSLFYYYPLLMLLLLLLRFTH